MIRTCAGNRACPPTCGDGRIDTGEECDDGPDNGSEPDSCRTSCRAPRCGDGILDTGEECDAGQDIGSPGECWQGCILEPDTACGSATVVDANQVAAASPRGFNFNAFGEYTAELGDDLTPPATCSNGSADGEDLVLYWVPEVTGWYQLNANFGQVEGDIVFWVMDAQCVRRPGRLRRRLRNKRVRDGRYPCGGGLPPGHRCRFQGLTSLRCDLEGLTNRRVRPRRSGLLTPRRRRVRVGVRVQRDALGASLRASSGLVPEPSRHHRRIPRLVRWERLRHRKHRPTREPERGLLRRRCRPRSTSSLTRTTTRRRSHLWRPA